MTPPGSRRMLGISLSARSNDFRWMPSDVRIGTTEEAVGGDAIGNGTKEPIGYALVWTTYVLRTIGDRTP